MPRTLLNLAAAFTISIFGLAASSAAFGADLTVEIRNAGDKGTVMVALFKPSDRWLGRASMGTAAPARNGAVTVTFKDLEEGEYAISLFVDENGNGRMDTNPIGIPIEPYAFSNDATGNFGPPSFEKAKFNVAKENKSIVINVK